MITETFAISPSTMTDMKCWICGLPASSSEHIVKKSDLGLVFGSKSRPLYLMRGVKGGAKVQGYKSNLLKFKQSLCANCNNNRTQPFDLAWTAFACKLVKSNRGLRAGMRIRTNRIFQDGTSVKDGLLRVHLYFVKLFGCLIVENQLPVPIEGFSSSLLKVRPHPNVRLSFWYGLNVSGSKKYAGHSEVQRNMPCGQAPWSGVVSWFYTIGNFSVKVTYYPSGVFTTRAAREWHPTQSGKVLHIVS